MPTFSTNVTRGLEQKEEEVRPTQEHIMEARLLVLCALLASAAAGEYNYCWTGCWIAF